MLQTSRFYRLTLITTVLAINIFLAGLLAYALNETKHAQERDVRKTVENLAIVLDQNIGQATSKIDMSLRVIADELERELRLRGRLDDLDVNALLGDRRAWASSLADFRVSDASGTIRFGPGVEPGRNTSLADRFYFITHRDHRDSGLIVSNPISARLTDGWFISFSRRYQNPDGSFAGMVTGAVPVGYFTQLLSGLDLGHGIALLRDADTGLIARYPAVPGPSGQLGAKGFSPELAEVIASGAMTKTYHAAQTADGVERINTYRRLSAVPFHLVVGMGAEDYLAQWHSDVTKACLLAAVFLFATSAAGALLWRSFSRTETASERSRLLLQHASDGIHILDENGRLIEASELFCRMLGYSKAEMIGKCVGDWDDHNPPARIADDIARQLSVNETLKIETRHRRKDGSTFDVEVSCSAFVLFGQRVLFCASRDVTARKLAETTLQQANQELEQFAYVASHDLQTPLRNMVSYAQLLEHRYKGHIDADADDFISFIVDSGKKMTQLIGDLLEYSCAGRPEPSRPQASAEAVNHAMSSLHLDLREAAADVAVGPLPCVMADASHLASLFQNLLGNAIKYRAPDRQLKISVMARREGTDLWRFAVADNGVGIEPEYFDKIFEMFQRLHPGLDAEGTGIGLALCRRIVHRFGGSIWVESTPGEGSTFFFTLPDGGGNR